MVRKLLPGIVLAIATAFTSRCPGEITGTTQPTTEPALEPITAGNFDPTWDSLQQYQFPQWFREAKFGIEADWSAQSLPGLGDDYARQLYVQGAPQYAYQVAHFGHPSKAGYKDVAHAWTAEHFDAAKLIDLYHRAGATYFIALANGPDNFDCFNSRFQPWNSVRVGPGKDIVGEWARAARAAGMHFGVTIGCADTWNWFAPAAGSDHTGPLAGVPYDGLLDLADGKGTWWDGLNPSDLYAQNHRTGEPPDTEYVKRFFNRAADLIQQVNPDLISFGSSAAGHIPFEGFAIGGVSNIGLTLAAHYYNTTSDTHSGDNQAVIAIDDLPEDHRSAAAWQLEAALPAKAPTLPWQCHVSLGPWQYDEQAAQQHRYLNAGQVVKLLCDVASRNGNLLLNVPLRGDGTLDDEETGVLNDLAGWMKTNGEALFGTNPWSVFGEGPTTQSTAAPQPIDPILGAWGAEDARFTAKQDTVYAIVATWPANGKLHLKTLASNSPNYGGEVGGITLLGSDAQLSWTRDESGLTIELPRNHADALAYVFRITPVPTNF